MRGTVVPQQVDFLVECGCGDTTRWVIWRNHALGGKANSYRSRKQTRIFQHFGRLFLPGTIQNVPCSLNELLVNFREESSGIGRFCRLKVPTDGQLAQFRLKKTKLGELYETGRRNHTLGGQVTKVIISECPRGAWMALKDYSDNEAVRSTGQDLVSTDDKKKTM